MAKKEKLKSIKNKQDLPPYEIMSRADIKTMFSATFMPYLDKKQDANKDLIEKSHKVLSRASATDICEDAAWGYYMPQYWLQKFCIENLQALKGLNGAGMVEYMGEDSIEDKIQYFETKFQDFEANKEEILLYDELKNSLLPYFENYSDSIKTVLQSEDVEDEIDVVAISDFVQYIDSTIGKINTYLDYVEKTPDEEYDEKKAKKMMHLASSMITIAKKRIKTFEFELEKSSAILKEVRNEKQKEQLLQSCKYFRLKSKDFYLFGSEVLSELKLSIPKNTNVKNPVQSCTLCEKKDYVEYCQFLSQINMQPFNEADIENIPSSDNWIIEEVSNELVNNESFNNVLKNGKFENIDELLNVAKAVFDGVSRR